MDSSSIALMKNRPLFETMSVQFCIFNVPLVINVIEFRDHCPSWFLEMNVEKQFNLILHIHFWLCNIAFDAGPFIVIQ